MQEVVDDYLSRGVGIYQLPCPEQRAWGGVPKRWMLMAYGAGGSLRGPAVRLALPFFLRHTRRVYARLARRVAADVREYRRAGVEVVGVVGIGGSPSCGVHTTLDLTGAVDVLTRCPLAALDRRVVNEDVVAAHVRPGEGMFVCALRRELRDVPFEEHDLLDELGVSRPAAPAP